MPGIAQTTALFLALLLSNDVHAQGATTAVPTTAGATTAAPTTAGATTVAPTTAGVTTAAPTTVAPTTAAPPPPTAAPTTPAPTTVPAPPPTPAPTECQDKHISCSNWAKNGYCRTNPGYMLNNCKLSCNACVGKTVKASFKLTNKIYNTKLADPRSAEFAALKLEVETSVTEDLKKTLAGKFIRYRIDNFKSGSGSVIVNGEVTIIEENQNSADDAVFQALKSSAVPGLDALTAKVGGSLCSTGFMDVNNQCLMFISRKLSWATAKADCERLNSRLVVPTDLGKLKSYIQNKNLHGEQYWVGASDQSPASSGTYEWLDGSGTDVDSGSWYPGFPTTSAAGVHPGQSCVKLYPSTNTEKCLIAAFDTNCDGTNTYRYICEDP
ncbi:unnamed protein product [Meganyctiphanes norvegica]|uniref:C-type lectin domain-containing protein n=1 Tax=Meganyctiphanes norvegica TaxID=48144 RepID=A0AAV2REB2_MEGNR